MTTWEVTTTDGVAIRYRPADVGSRAAALWLDLFCIAVAWAALGFGATRLPPGLEPTGVGIQRVLSLVVFFGCFIVGEALGGQTVGKRLVGVRVMRDTGAPCGWAAGILRNVLLIVDFLPALFLVGFVTILVSRKRQRIGDLVAGTVVVSSHGGPRRRHPIPRPDPTWPLERTALRGALPALGDVMNRTLRFLERRDAMLNDAAKRVADSLAREAQDALGITLAGDPLAFLEHLAFLREELTMPADAANLVDGAPLTAGDVERVLRAAYPRGFSNRLRRGRNRAQFVAGWRHDHPELVHLDDDLLWVALVHRAWRIRTAPSIP
jgi:uncharacterized RDD family membrane protein YckC